jgi:hypothetical protein
MIGHCFNPDCRKELRYLRHGSVYQWERGVGREFRSEFFWLCPICSSAFAVASADDGEPLLVRCGMKREGDRRGSRIRRVFREALPECVVDCPDGVVSGTIRQAPCPVMTAPPELPH